MSSWEGEQRYEIQQKQQAKAIEKLAEALRELTEAGYPLWTRNSEKPEEVRFDVSFTFTQNGEFAAYGTNVYVMGERPPETEIFKLAVDGGELEQLARRQMEHSENE